MLVQFYYISLVQDSHQIISPSSRPQLLRRIRAFFPRSFDLSSNRLLLLSAIYTGRCYQNTDCIPPSGSNCVINVQLYSSELRLPQDSMACIKALFDRLRHPLKLGQTLPVPTSKQTIAW